MSDTPTASQLLAHLPAVLREDPQGGALLGRFLLAFEQLLDQGAPAEDGHEAIPGIGRYLDHIAGYFTPDAKQGAPDEFVPWLARWVALNVSEHWSAEQTRDMIAGRVQAHRIHGTLAGLIATLDAYAGEEKVPAPNEFVDLPDYLQVRLPALTTRDAVELRRRELAARAAIDQEKPAHTYYALRIPCPTMRVGEHSTVAVDTLLGDLEQP
jgi:phage tail-like protein